MLKVGITGGIGSGKSLVCEIFGKLGIPVFNADFEAKNLLKTPRVIEFYKENFGESVLTNNQLDNQKIAQKIFNNKEALARVNHFIHPMVFELFEKWTIEKSHAPYVIKEAALLFESGGYTSLDYTILVCAPEEIRIERVIRRSGLTREQALHRIANQWDDNKKKKLCDFVLENDGRQAILQKILDTHNFLKNQ